MARKKYVKMWVDPEFKKKCKQKALDDDLSLIEFTRRKARRKGWDEIDSVFW